MSVGVPTFEPLTAPTLRSGTLTVELSPSGDVHAIRADGLLVNQFLPGPHDPMAAGVYLRRHTPDGIAVCPIVGSTREVASFAIGSARAVWTGHSLGVDHTVELTVSDDSMWVWRVSLTDPTTAGSEYDVVVAQDMALSPPGTALSSEPYVCQYLVHRVLDHPNGPAIASRQAMTDGPRLPLVISSIVEGATGYATDAMQTHTPSTRLDGAPHGLAAELPNKNYQYELATPTLVSGRLRPGAEPAVVHAYAVVQADVPGDLTQQAERLDDWAALAIEAASRSMAIEPIDVTRSALRHAPLVAGHDVTDAELLAVAGIDATDVLLPETDAEGHLLSFFTADDAHVVRGTKELQVERSHGHVLKAGDDVAPNDDILSATAYAPGVFASHVVLGNTSANRLVTVQRHHLGLQHTSGVRVWVSDPVLNAEGSELKGAPADPAGLRLLGLPSVVRFDLGGTHWVYLTDLGRIDVRTVAAAHENRIDIVVESERPLRILATIDVEPGDDAPRWNAEHVDATTVRLVAAAGTDVADRCPHLTYLLGSSAPIGDDAALFDGLAPAPTGLLVTEATGHLLELTVAGSLTNPDLPARLLADRRGGGLDVGRELAGHRETMRSLALGLRLGGTSAVPADELDVLLPWYVHDGLVHFLVPHGLEQYSGAAWGTRDVCQGPFELHLAFGRFDIARQILLTTFAHQNPVGDFPQWFMFDAYEDRYNDDAHGDVPVWPLFALGQYLRATGDLALLDAEVSFWDDTHRRHGADPVPLSAHVERLLDYLDDHRLPGTSLPAYGHGDWDDTLQPAEPAMRTTMASTWTSALLAQAAQLTSEALAASGTARGQDLPLAERLATHADGVAADLRAHMLVDGVLAGYLNRGTDGTDEPVIHPADDRTGITYRLIPMTRSIIAGIFDADEAGSHEALIREHLHFPDGVRLMDRPAAFDDGVPHVFLRAEQAANVGREIGLMYTHAHIRWVEALAALGRPDTLAELIRISPVGINSRLPHAAPRQRNVYYSSSDAAFADRYAFAAGFDLLRTGGVNVKGGWRVYSSGPGIYLRQLVQGVLGITLRSDSVVFNPVLPLDADGLTAQIDLAGERRQVRYIVQPSRHAQDGSRAGGAQGDGGSADGVQVEVRGGATPDTLAPLRGTIVSNRYRQIGVEIPFDALAGCPVLEVVVSTGNVPTSPGL